MMLLLGGLAGQTVGPAAGTAPVLTAPVKKTVVYVIPVKDEINSPTLYILRRGLKEAIERIDTLADVGELARASTK